jgi:hypothetical protein
MPVEVKGAIELRKALRAYAPDLAKLVTKEMGFALRPVAKAARGYAVGDSQILSNWLPKTNSQGRFPTYSGKAVDAGIGYKTSPSKANTRGFRSLAKLFNKNAAGAIYETAGRNTPNSVFVQNLNNKTGGQMKGSQKMQGRVLYRAYEENQGKAQDGVLRAIEQARVRLNSRSKVVN